MGVVIQSCSIAAGRETRRLVEKVPGGVKGAYKEPHTVAIRPRPTRTRPSCARRR